MADHNEIVLKELDHIQAVLGRFDTFFFLMKQVSVGGMAAFFVASTSNNLKSWIFVIPIIFYLMECCFRFLYWTRYVRRLNILRSYLQIKTSIRLYEIVDRDNSFSVRGRWERLRKAFKWFDLIYYGVWVIAACAAAQILRAECIGL